MKKCFCSWSGGKDSCLALYKAVQAGYAPQFLLTTFLESGDRTRSHGLAVEILQAQAACIGLPVVGCNTSWHDYRRNFINAIRAAKIKIVDVAVGVFGDIDIEEHQKWVQEVCFEINCEALLPLWQHDRKELLTEFLSLGFKAIIVAVEADSMCNAYLGHAVDETLLEELAQQGIDPSGENGEYHTVVIDGPLFTNPIKITKVGRPQLRSSYWYQDFRLLVK